MKRFLILTLFVLCFSNIAYSQTNNDNKNILSAKFSILYYEDYAPMISYERIVSNMNNNSSIGVGGSVGYDIYWGGFIIGAHSSYHYTGISKWDFFGSVGLDYDVYEYMIFSNLKVGASYMFSDQFGVVSEIGSGIENFSIGVNYKF